MIARAPGWSLTASPEQVLAAVGADQVRLRQAQRAVAEVLRAHWVAGMMRPGRGRFYEAGLRFVTRGGRVIPITDRSGVARKRAPHRAGAPGDYPAADSGASAASIEVDDSDPDALRVGSNRRSLLAQEYGVNTSGSMVGRHPGGITILPRPGAHRAVEDARQEMNDVFHRVLRG